MPDSKITALTAITTVNPATFPLVIVDTSDTSMAITGTTKKVTTNQLLGSGGTATLASATITGDLTVKTNVLKVDTTNNRVGIGTASPTVSLDMTVAGAAGDVNAFRLFRNTDTLNDSISILFSTNGRTSAVRHIQPGGGIGTLCFDVQGSEQYRIGSGTFTWYDGAGGTRMTLNATGLGVGTTVQYARLTVSGSNSTGIANIQNSAFASNALGTLSCYIGHDATANRPFIQAATGNAGNAFDLLIQPYGGNVGIGVTPAGTGGCLQLKSGITFPATQVPSSDANTLDDYEEGTWTGTIGGTTGNPTTPVTATGRYTKIGRQVYVEIGFYGDTTGASGRITVSGLPFTSNASIARPGAILMDTMGTFTGSPVAFLGSGVTSLDLYASNSNGAISSVTHNTGAGRALYMELTYTV